jgi:hypothetical protein
MIVVLTIDLPDTLRYYALQLCETIVGATFKNVLLLFTVEKYAEYCQHVHTFCEKSAIKYSSDEIEKMKGVTSNALLQNVS